MSEAPQSVASSKIAEATRLEWWESYTTPVASIPSAVSSAKDSSTKIASASLKSGTGPGLLANDSRMCTRRTLPPVPLASCLAATKARLECSE